jgi:hypothetical protein
MTAPYRLELEIPGLPKMANASGGSRNFWVQATEAKRWVTTVQKACIGKLPPEPLMFYRLTLIRLSSVEPDYDGLVRGFKSVVDGLRAAGVIADDRLTNSGPWHCHWVKTSPKCGRIFVRVDPDFDAAEARGNAPPLSSTGGRMVTDRKRPRGRKTQTGRKSSTNEGKAHG